MAFASRAPAQDEPDLAVEVQPVEPPQPEGLERAAGIEVYLNDSLEAADAFHKAADLAGQSRWREAAEILYKAAQDAGDKLILSEPGLYTSVEAQVARQASMWPPAGLEAYRALAEPQAIAAIRRAGESRNIQDLLTIFERSFATRSALELADRVGQLAIEAGDLVLAEQVYRRVVETHPDARDAADKHRAMLAVVLTMRGKPPGELPQGARLRWMGQDVLLPEALAAVSRDFAALRTEPPITGWPTFGGDGGRNRPTATSVDEPGLLWRTSLAEDGDSDSEGVRDNGVQEASRLTQSRPAIVFPAVALGKVFAQHDREVLALHQNTGAVVWRYQAAGTQADSEDYLVDQPPEWQSPTVWGGRVFATLTAEEPLFYQYDPSRRGAELVCLDAADGRLVWALGPEALNVKSSEFAIDPSPIVEQDRVYVVARRRRSFGFEDAYLLRVNAADGTVEFRVHIGSASTNAYRHRPSSIPGLWDGVVYACSGLGSVAAVSAYTGDVLWLRTYERSREQDGEESVTAGRARRWPDVNATLRADGRVCVLPPDGGRVLVLEQATGNVVAQVGEGELGGGAILGIRDGLLCGVGGRAFCYDLGAGSLKWSADLPQPASGRSVWAGSDLLVPTVAGLVRFEVSGGARNQAPWDAAGRGGNLVALPDQLIVADSQAISAYLPKANIWKSLRERMQGAPADPLPALELAEVALGAGEYWEAFEVSREAVRRLRESPADPALRKRLFTHAQKLAALLSTQIQGDSTTLHTLCSFAADHAGDPQSNLEYRLHFARIFEKTGELDAALRLYQQVLLDRSLRVLEPQGAASLGRPAAIVVERRIAAVLAKNGRDLYADYEAESQRWLTSAEAAQDEAAFRRVIEAFPNSLAAGSAFVQYGDWLARHHRHEEAWRLYIRAYNHGAPGLDRAAAARKIADSLERLGRAGYAYRWLSKADRDLPGATVGLDQRRVSLAEYRDHLSGARVLAEPAPPLIRLPLDDRQTIALGDGESLLVPRFAEEPGQTWSTLYVGSRGNIRAVKVAGGQPAWHSELDIQSDLELLIARDDVVVLADTFELIGLDAATGSVLWQIGSRPAHAADPGGDWEEGGAFRAHAIDGDCLVSVRDTGEVAAVSIGSGKSLWRQSYSPAAFGAVRVVYPWVVYHVVQSGRVVICVLDADTGASLGSIITDESRPVEDLFVTVDGRVIVVSSRAISTFDLERHTMLWQVPLSGQVRPGSMVLDFDALYFSDSGIDLQKLRLSDGARVWQSDRITDRGVDDLTVRLIGGALLASTSSSVVAIDRNMGLTLWRGITPERPRFEHRLVTDSYLAAVDTAGQIRDEPCRVYFYTHRDNSGVIPAAGGGLNLGELPKVRSVMALDGGIAIHAADRIEVYRAGSPPAEP